jgi:hypothetical protein
MFGMKRFIHIVCILAARVIAAPVSIVHAQGTSMLYLKGPRSAKTGQIFQIELRLNAGAGDIDTVRANGTFPTDHVEWAGYSLGSAFPNSSPTSGADAGNGTFSIGAFRISDGVDGDVLVANLLFRAMRSGDISISLLSNSRALSSGVDRFSSVNGLHISISGQPVDEFPMGTDSQSGITFTSTSHPDEDAWSSNRAIELSWSGISDQVSKVYFTFDQNPQTTPDAEMLDTVFRTTVEEDGIYFGHIRVVFINGREVVLHHRFNIDATSPVKPQPSLDQDFISSDVPNTVRFGTTDSMSGIRHYVVTVDGAIHETEDGFFELPRLGSGAHTIIVTAVDRAGNSSSNSIGLTIIGVPSVVADFLNLKGESPSIQIPTALGVALILLFIVLVTILILRLRKYHSKEGR